MYGVLQHLLKSVVVLGAPEIIFSSRQILAPHCFCICIFSWAPSPEDCPFLSSSNWPITTPRDDKQAGIDSLRSKARDARNDDQNLVQPPTRQASPGCDGQCIVSLYRGPWLPPRDLTWPSLFPPSYGIRKASSDFS